MTTIPSTCAVPATRSAARPRLAERLLAFPSRMLREARLRRASATLESLPDDILADIGLARSEIADAVRHGRPWRDGPCGTPR